MTKYSIVLEPAASPALDTTKALAPVLEDVKM
jgi:hypothetical protein